MKILFSARSFDNMAGGLERMAISIMNEMVFRGHEVSLLTWDYESAKTFYLLNNKIDWYKISLGDPNGKSSWLIRAKRVSKIRRFIHKKSPDVVIAFQHGIFFALKIYTLGMNMRFIAAERNALSMHNYTSAGKFQYLIFQSFRMANKITIQFPEYIYDYPEYLHKKMIVIPNRVNQVEKYSYPKLKENTRKVLLSVGRLSFQKNFGLLIRCFAEITDDFPEWELKIAGDGEQFEFLSQLILDNELSNKVKLLGAVKNVDDLYLNSDIFCLPSLWEGFPNSLAEALSFGLPSVGFRESSGVSNLIIDDVNGLLAEGNENIVSLSNALKKLMKNSALRNELSKGAIKSVTQYKKQLIMNQWEDLCERVKE